MASVCMERTSAISSAMEPMCGSNSEISMPDWPWRSKRKRLPTQLSGWPMSWAMRWPLVRLSGMGLPFIFTNWGLGSKRSRCDGAPDWKR